MIKEIQIDRFKSLRHTEQVKMGRVTLLTGANGRGKSSFCQSLLALSQTWRRGMMDSLLPAGAWKDLGTYDDIVFAFDEDKTIRIHIITDAENGNDFDLHYRQSAENPTLGEVQDVKVGGKPINDDSGNSSDGEGEADSESPEEEQIRISSLGDFTSLMALKRMFYVAADRVAAPGVQQLDETIPYEYMAPTGENVLNVLWKNKNSDCIKKAQEMLNRVLDGGRIVLEPAGDRLVLRINSVDDGKFYQPVNVGYGYSYILSLITAAVLAPKDSYIIVENPEAHLHPSAQAKMMNELIEVAKERDIQLIVETHSDHVLNTALRAVNERRLGKDDLAVLFFFNYQGEEGFIEARVRNLDINSMGHILNPPKQFFEQYSTDLRALYATPARHE